MRTKVLITIFIMGTVQFSIFAKDSLDFTGVERFWLIVELLEKDIQPSDEQWDSLFDTLGYRYLVKVEGKGNLFKKYFPLAFMPSKKEELAKELASDTFPVRHYLRHYLAVKEKRNELDKFQNELKEKNLLENALVSARQFLPKGVIEKYPPPPVTFAVFEPDGKADESVIVIDLLYATRNSNLTLFVAHEAHHYYLGKFSKLKGLDRDADEYLMLRTIKQLSFEGIADLIDKSSILDEAAYRNRSEGARNYQKDFIRIYNQSLEIFRQIDELIRESADSPAKLKENSKKMWSLLAYGGHPNGFYLAQTIVENLGKDVLIEQMKNPFECLRLYNKAAKKASEAKKENYFVFSKKSMNFLKNFEKKYVRK